MIGVDTNIVIRLLTRDDEKQFSCCEKLLSNSSEDNPLVVNPIVIAETIWILEKRYSIEMGKARQTLHDLLNTLEFKVLEKLTVSPWYKWFTANHAGIFDALIAEINRESGCAVTYTFDKQAAKNVDGMELLI